MGRLQQLHKVLCIQRASFSSQKQPKVIQVSPEISQFDQKIHIRLCGFPSHSKITVHALTENVWQRKTVQFGSCGHYTTDQSGDVDMEKDASLGGTYTGVESMGLFWSIKPNPFGPKNTRLVIRKVEKPVLYKLSVYEGHLPLEDLFKCDSLSTPLSTRTVERMVLAEGVRRIPVKEGKLRGVLFLPPGRGPFPGVLDMFGMAGGIMEARAALLASHGFAAYTLPMFGYDDLPKSPGDQTFDYFEDTARWLGSHPSVVPGGIGVMGVSAGAGYALIMAYQCPEVKALIRINGNGFNSMMFLEDADQSGRCFPPGEMPDINKSVKTSEGLILRDVWVLDDSQAIPLWKKDVHALSLHSDDDGSINPWETDRVRDKLYPAERRHLMTVVHYPGAGHLLEPPYTPLCRACYNPFFGTDLVWGGHPREHSIAQEESWERIQQFLRKHLPSPS